MRESWTDERLDEFRGRIDERFDRVDEKFDRVDEKFDEMGRRFDEVDRRFAEVDRRFEEVDNRLAETNQRIGRLEIYCQQEFGRLNDRLDSIQRTIAFGSIALSSSVIGGFVALATLS